LDERPKQTAAAALGLAKIRSSVVSQCPPRPPIGGPEPEPDDDDDEGERPEKTVVKLSDGNVRKIKFLSSTTYWSSEGKPISAAEFLERLFGDLSGLVADEDQLRAMWSDPDSRERLLNQLFDRGYDAGRLDDIRRLVDAEDSDLFDVLGYVLFTHEPKSRHERAEAVRAAGLGGFNHELKDLLIAILEAYEISGVSELATTQLGKFLVARYGSVNEGKAKLGGLPAAKNAFRSMQASLYAD